MPTYALSRIDVGDLNESPEVAKLEFATFMTIFLNGNEIGSGDAESEDFGEGFYFVANQGDSLQLVLTNETGADPPEDADAFLDPVWLISETGSRKLTDGFPTGTYPANSTVFNATFAVTTDPQVEDEKERRDKRPKSCHPCPCQNSTGSEGQANASFTTSAGISMSYNSYNSSNLPASMGYGWAMGVLQARLDFPPSGDLVFYDGSGSFERWVLDGSDYVPAHPNNYIQAQENMDGSFTLTFRDQTRMNFDSSGVLETILDRNENTTTFDRDGNGHVISVDDGEGRFLYLDYDGRTDGQPRYLRRQDDTTGLTVELIYDGNDRLWKMVEHEGETTEFLYDGDGRLWKKIDPRGQVEVEFSYYDSGDYEGRVETETIYGERKITYTYTATTQTMVEEDLSALSDDLPRTTVLTFGEFGQLVSKVDPIGNLWEWEYNDPLNPYLMTKAIDPNLNFTEYEYDEDSQLISMTDAQNSTTTFTYNQPGDTGYTAAKRFLIKEVQRPTVTVPSTVTYAPTQYEYDSLGNLIEIIDAANESTLFTVRSDGRVTKVTNRRGKEFDLTYTAGGGGLTLGNLETVTAPAGPNSAPARVTTFTYDAYDRVTQVEDNVDKTLLYQYDGNDRVTRRTDQRSKYTEFAFSDGVLDYIEMPTNGGSGMNRRQTRFEYDDASRVKEVFAQKSTTVEESRVRMEFDGFANLRKLGRLRDSLEMLHQFNFDKLDRLLATIDPLLRETETVYEPFCTERTVTTPRGVERTYRFDSLCRLTQVESGQELVTFDYDELHRPYRVTQGLSTRYGKVTSLFGESPYGASANRVTLLAYDELDRVTLITFPDSETIAYVYDEEGAVTQMTDVHGKVTRYTYYDDGRLYQVILERPSVADRVFSYKYDAAGRLEQIDYPSATNIVVKFSGPSSEPGWDDAGNLLHMRYLLSNAHLHRFAYTYDDAGNRISMTDTPTNTANEVLWEYGYDWLDRLTSVSRGGTPTTVYAYDESDNRISLEWPQDSVTHDFTYDDANQIVARKLGVTVLESYEHDQDGNMIARTASGVTTQYRWSDKNRLLDRKVAGVSAERHKYDAGGIRESKNDGTKYFSSGDVSVADMRPSSVPVSYFQGHQLLGMEVNGTFYYYVTDGLANVRLVLDASGSIVASTVFDEFGIPEDVSGSADLRPHGYTGGLGVRNDWDSSGLHYMRQRYYDPQLGRWLSADPIGFKGGLNLYEYCFNNPTTLVDPSGLDVIVPPSVQAQLSALLQQNPAMAGGTTASDMYNSFKPGKSGNGIVDLTILSRPEKSPIPAVTVRQILKQNPITKTPCNDSVFIVLFDENARTDADVFLFLATELGNAYALAQGRATGGDRGPTDVESNWFAVKAAAANPDVLSAAKSGGVTDRRASGAIQATAAGEIQTQADFLNWMNSH